MTYTIYRHLGARSPRPRGRAQRGLETSGQHPRFTRSVSEETRFGLGYLNLAGLRSVTVTFFLLACFFSAPAEATIILEMDANDPGPAPSTRWRPTIGDDGVDAGLLLRSSSAVPLPTLNSEVNGGTTNQFFTFTHTATTQGFTGVTDGSFVGGFQNSSASHGAGSSRDLYFPTNQAYSVEVWIRADTMAWADNQTCCADLNIGQIVGTQTLVDHTGWSMLASVNGPMGVSEWNAALNIARNATEVGAPNIGLGTTGTPIQSGSWYYLVGTYNGNPASPDGKVYVNGALVADAESGSLPSNNVPNFDSFTIGARDGRFIQAQGPSLSGGPIWFGGDIALIRIHDTELPGTQVQANFLTDGDRFGVVAPVPVTTNSSTIALLALLLISLTVFAVRQTLAGGH